MLIKVSIAGHLPWFIFYIAILFATQAKADKPTNPRTSYVINPINRKHTKKD